MKGRYDQHTLYMYEILKQLKEILKKHYWPREELRLLSLLLDS